MKAWFLPPSLQYDASADRAEATNHIRAIKLVSSFNLPRLMLPRFSIHTVYTDTTLSQYALSFSTQKKKRKKGVSILAFAQKQPYFVFTRSVTLHIQFHALQTVATITQECFLPSSRHHHSYCNTSYLTSHPNFKENSEHLLQNNQIPLCT